MFVLVGYNSKEAYGNNAARRQTQATIGALSRRFLVDPLH
jgi:hypothetical protein